MLLIYAFSIFSGMILVHADYRPALRFRDALVARAHRADPSARADAEGRHLQAATIDFTRNLFVAAIPETVSGFTLVMPVGLAAYRGWVGGVVSVDGKHRTRFRTARSATYYVIVMLLQVTGFTLAGAAGLHLGWANIRHLGPFAGPRWFRLPLPAVRDVAWLYAVIIPLLAAGSLFEFLVPQ